LLEAMPDACFPAMDTLDPLPFTVAGNMMPRPAKTLTLFPRGAIILPPEAPSILFSPLRI